MPVHERPVNAGTKNPESGDLFQIPVRQKSFKKGLSSRSFNQIARTVLALLDLPVEDTFQFRGITS